MVSHIENTLGDEHYEVFYFQDEVIKHHLIDAECLIIIGYPLGDALYEKAGKAKKKKIIYFTESLGIFRNAPASFPHITFIEKRFSDFYPDYIKQKPSYSPQIDVSSTNSFFVGRGPEKNQWLTFNAAKNARACFISGMRGIGKRAFVNELKKNYGLENNFDIYFNGQKDTLADDVIEPLCAKMGLTVNKAEYHFEEQNGLVVKNCQEIFKKFDERRNVNIIFWNTGYIYNKKSKSFYRKEFEIFFRLMITYNYQKASNKIYFVSESRIWPGFLADSDFYREIKLKFLLPNIIKTILYQSFTIQNASEYAQIVRYKDDKIIDQKICGHPYLAKRFVDHSIQLGLQTLLENDLGDSPLEKDKIKLINEAMLQNSQLYDDELFFMKHSVLFTKHIETDYFVNGSFIYNFERSFSEIITSLQDRFFLDTELIKDKSGSARHYVPRLIKDYILGLLTPNDLYDIHTGIGKFYWDRAEDFRATKEEEVEGYQLALHHYSSVGNKEAEIRLIQRFEVKYLEKAENLYQLKRHRDAYFYFNELYKHGRLKSNKTLLNFFLKSAGRVGADFGKIQEIYNYAMSLYPYDEFIPVTYAGHLLRIGRTEDAGILAESVLQEKNDNYAMNALYIRILAQNGETQKAINRTKYWVEVFKNKNRKSKADERHIGKFNNLLYELNSGRYSDGNNNFDKTNNSPRFDQTLSNLRYTDREIKIFIASSRYLSERQDIKLFLSEINSSLPKGCKVIPSYYELFSEAIQEQGSQNSYNDEILQCDAFFAFFHDRIGENTREEFENALNGFKTNKKPRHVFIYFKKADFHDIEPKELKKIIDFKDYLSKIKHYPSYYTDFDNLKGKMQQEIIRIYNAG